VSCGASLICLLGMAPFRRQRRQIASSFFRACRLRPRAAAARSARTNTTESTPRRRRPGERTPAHLRHPARQWKRRRVHADEAARTRVDGDLTTPCRRCRHRESHRRCEIRYAAFSRTGAPGRCCSVCHTRFGVVVPTRGAPRQVQNKRPMPSPARAGGGLTPAERWRGRFTASSSCRWVRHRGSVPGQDRRPRSRKSRSRPRPRYTDGAGHRAPARRWRRAVTSLRVWP
jgi:hypothetical protein